MKFEFKMTTVYFLIGRASHKITGENVPTLRNLLRVLLNYRYVSKLSVFDSAMETVKLAEAVWKKHNIEMKSLKYCAEKLRKAFNEWRSIDDFKQRTTDKYKRKRIEFTKKLDKVFEVKAVQKPEGKKRPHPDTSPETVTLTSLSSSSENVDEEGIFYIHIYYYFCLKLIFFTNTAIDDEDFRVGTEKHPKKEFINSHVVDTIDAINISDRQAMRLLSAAAQALGHNLKDLVISTATIRRVRRENRKKTHEAVKLNFKVFSEIN